MNAPSWIATFPRLGEIYCKSDCGNPDNYFKGMKVSNVLSKQPLNASLVELEETLSVMDLQDWNDFMKRSIPYVTAKDQWGWHSQLYERFHEARGYVFLKEQGCREVHFISEEQNQRTPDLYGKGYPGEVLLEAKRVRDSDDENKYLKKPIQQKHMRKIVHALPNPLKDKLNSTVQRAKDQLYGHNCVNDCRRILFLSIRLDLCCATHETKQQIEEYLSQIGTDIEIVHRSENDFFL